MPRPTPRPPEDPGRPTPREAIAKARAEAGPRVAKAVEAAAPKVEKAAVHANKLFGTLRDRAKDTARQFREGYQSEESTTPGDSEPAAPESAPRRPKPGPRQD
jgi:hypothetical protein